MISINTTVILGVIALAIVIMTFYGSTSSVKEGLSPTRWLCKDCEIMAVKKNLGVQYTTDKLFPTICPTRGNEKDCTAAGGQWVQEQPAAPLKPAPQCSSFTCPAGTSSLSSSGCLKTPNTESGGAQWTVGSHTHDATPEDCVAEMKATNKKAKYKNNQTIAFNYNKAGKFCYMKWSSIAKTTPTSSWDFYNCTTDTKTCTGGECDSTQCCGPNPTCNSLSSCPAGRQFKAGKNSITCAGATCVSTDCCEAIPKPKCTSFTCAAHSTKRSGAEDITCKTYNCTEEECCSPDPKPNCGQQDVSCPTNYHHLSNPGATECAGYTCNTKDCCTPNPQCASHTCWAGTTTKSPSKICKGATCTDPECCSDNPKCSSFKCPSNMDSANTPTKTCSGAQCKPSDCCIGKATCKSFGTCDANHTSAPSSTVCEGTECTSAECCIPNPTCDPYTCGTGYTKKAKNEWPTPCAELPCEKKECCRANPTCLGWTCPKGETRKLLSDEYTCKTSKCTQDECCGANPTCNTHTCSSSFYSLGSLLKNADDITCGGPKCTDSECCAFKPSNSLPSVNQWPLYK